MARKYGSWTNYYFQWLVVWFLMAFWKAIAWDAYTAKFAYIPYSLQRRGADRDFCSVFGLRLVFACGICAFGANGPRIKASFVRWLSFIDCCRLFSTIPHKMFLDDNYISILSSNLIGQPYQSCAVKVV